MSETRRDFFTKLVASGLGIVPALKQSVPESELHKLEPDATYLIVVPRGSMTYDHLVEMQEYMNFMEGMPKFILVPLDEVQIYKL